MYCKNQILENTFYKFNKRLEKSFWLLW